MARKKHARPASLDGQPLSRDVSVGYYAAKRRRRARKHILVGFLVALLIVFVGGGVALASFIGELNAKISGNVDSSLREVLVTQEPGKPFYLLLIGIDKDEGRVSDPEYGAEDSEYRSDSIILTRVDPSKKLVTMVSIHRDTLVDMDEHGPQKINAAYSFGQEAYTTKFISRFAGVPISHYAEIDMDGLVAVIDSIGGIDVDVPMDISDTEYTGLELKAGLQHMDGKTAALYCRSRHAYDALGDGDRYRAANQRQVISIVARKILTSDPATIAKTVSTAATYVRTDMDVQSIVSLAMQFIGMDTENDFYSGMEPTTGYYTNETWYELCDTTAWRKMMHRVDEGLPPTEEGDVDPLESSPTPDFDSVEVGYETYETYDYDEDSY